MLPARHDDDDDDDIYIYIYLYMSHCGENIFLICFHLVWEKCVSN